MNWIKRLFKRKKEVLIDIETTPGVAYIKNGKSVSVIKLKPTTSADYGCNYHAAFRAEFYDPAVQKAVTETGQKELIDLAELFKKEGVHLKDINTDPSDFENFDPGDLLD